MKETFGEEKEQREDPREDTEAVSGEDAYEEDREAPEEGAPASGKDGREEDRETAEEAPVSGYGTYEGTNEEHREIGDETTAATGDERSYTEEPRDRVENSGAAGEKEEKSEKGKALKMPNLPKMPKMLKKKEGGGGFNLRIGNKIAIGFLLVIIIFGVVSVQTWMAFNDLEEAIYDSNVAAETYNDVAQMDAELWRQYAYIYEYVNLGRTESLPNYEAAAERFDELFERVSRGIEDPEIIEELERITIMKESMESVLYESIIPNMGTDGEQFNERRLRNVESRIRYIGESFAIVREHIQEDTQTIIREAEEVIASERRQLIVFLGIALGIAVIVTVVLSRGISKPLKELQEEAERVAKGDLTLEFNGSKGKDEVGELSRSFAQMTRSLKTLISSVKEASGKATQSSEILMETAKQSSGASEDLSKTIQEIAETADNQAQNTTEGTEKASEMAATIEDVSTRTEGLKKSTENADRLREQGVKVVDDLFDKTETINQVTSEVSKIIQETDANTEKINKASIVIHSISEQTGLLALNAAIESARAGEAGRGFAVVAEEIRKLADQASNSTKEIEDIVKVLKEKSNVAVRDMKNLEGTISDQGEAVNATKGIFNDLSNAIDNTKEETHGVESYVEVMLGKKDEIVDVINQLASIAEENAASTEEASAATEEQTASMEEIQSASEQLTNLSYDLMEVVGEFKV